MRYSWDLPYFSSWQAAQAQETAEDVVSPTGRCCSGQADSVALDLEMANSAVGLIVCHGQNCPSHCRSAGLQVDYVEWACTRPSGDYTFLGSELQELSSVRSVVEWQQLDANQTALYTTGRGQGRSISTYAGRLRQQAVSLKGAERKEVREGEKGNCL